MSEEFLNMLKKKYWYACSNPDCDAMFFTKNLYKIMDCPVCGKVMELAENKL